jgi:hypothetical protein
LRSINALRLTHPVIAGSTALSTVNGKEGKKKQIIFPSSPSFRLAGERVGQRSVAGVSQRSAFNNANLCRFISANNKIDFLLFND